jgi:hypothetical protein
MLIVTAGIWIASPDETIITIPSNDGRFISVDDEQFAEAILVFEVKVPFDSGHKQEFYLKRNPRPKRSSGSVTLGLGSAFAACGGDGGSGGYIVTDIMESGLCRVDFSFHWNTKKTKGDVKDVIDVPWLGESTKDLGNGATAHLSFRRPNREPQNEVPVTGLLNR